MMDNEQFVALIDRLRQEPAELEWLEFKETKVQPNEALGEYLSALSNGAALARRKEIALEMTAAEIAEAQRLAREWLATEKLATERRTTERTAIEALYTFPLPESAAVCGFEHPQGQC